MTLTTHHLTLEESIDRGKQLARALAKREQIERDRKTSNDGYKRELEEIEIEISMLALTVRTGQEERDAQLDLPMPETTGEEHVEYDAPYDQATGEVYVEEPQDEPPPVAAIESARRRRGKTSEAQS